MKQIAIFIRKRYFLLSGLIIFITVSFLGYFYSPYPLSKFYSLEDIIFKKSYAHLYIKENKIYLDFEILEKDQIKYQDFFSKLGIEKINNGISFELDENTTVNLSQILPQRLKIAFDQNHMYLQTSNTKYIKSSISAQKYKLATGSAKASLDYVNEKDFSLDVYDPGPLVSLATASGQLYFSKRLTSLFPMLTKIARIYLKVDGQNIEGEIKLK